MSVTKVDEHYIHIHIERLTIRIKATETDVDE